jgi:hypothetical protein
VSIVEQELLIPMEHLSTRASPIFKGQTKYAYYGQRKENKTTNICPQNTTKKVTELGPKIRLKLKKQHFYWWYYYISESQQCLEQ